MRVTTDYNIALLAAQRASQRARGWREARIRTAKFALRAGGGYSTILACFLRFRLRARAALARFFSPGFR
jgi:hypothetical protein